MGYKKISELSGITSPSLSGVTIIVDNGTTYKSTLQNLRNTLVDSGSHYFTGSQTINGNLTVSNSTFFGNSFDDNHIFSGSLKMSGPLTASFFVGDGSHLINLPEHSDVSMFLSSSVFNTFQTLYFEESSSFNSRIISATNEQNLTNLATTGSNTFIGNQTISGSLYVTEITEVTNIQGTGSLYLKPDFNDSRDFKIYNTAPSDIHLKGNAAYSFFGDDTNFLKIDDNTSTITLKSTNGIIIDTPLNIKGVSENFIIDGGFSGNRTFDYTSGSIFYLTGVTGNGIWNIENVPTESNKVLSLTYVIEQTSTPYSSSQYQINGSNVTVKWVDNISPTGSANNTEVIGLSAFRINTSWNIIGSLSTFGIS